MMSYFKKACDPMSSYTHFWGAILSLLATLAMVLVYFLQHNSDNLVLVAIGLFGFGLMALYSASCIYHFVKGPAQIKLRLRKLDHAMIYVLIAGSYTPVCAKFLPDGKREVFIIGIWAAAILGIIVKVVWLDAPRWLYTSLYLLMGWAIIFDIKAFSGVPLPCLALIAAGGLSYTLGAIIYIIKKPDIWKNFGFHEVFHILIMVGSAFHVAAVIAYIL